MKTGLNHYLQRIFMCSFVFVVVVLFFLFLVCGFFVVVFFFVFFLRAMIMYSNVVVKQNKLWRDYRICTPQSFCKKRDLFGVDCRKESGACGGVFC